MAMHLAGWYQNVDPAGSPVQLDALEDPQIFTEGKNIRINELLMIAGAGACITTADTVPGEAYLYSPTLNIMGDSFVFPINSHATAGVPSDAHVRWADYMDAPVMVAYDELLRGYANGNPAAAGPQGIFVMFSDGNTMAIPNGTHITWKGTFSAPAATGVWSAVRPTWESELPPGDYAVVGMQVVALTTMAGRINTRQGRQWRPGVLAQQNAGTLPADFQKSGKYGVWAMFPYTQLPTLEILANTAAAGTIYLDIVRINDRSNPTR